MSKGRKTLKGLSIAEIPLKVVLAGVFGLVGLLVLMVGAIGVGLGAGLGAAIGGAVGGSEGASEAANNVEMPVSILVTSYVFFGLAGLTMVVGLPLSCATLKKVKTAQSKKELKGLSIANLFFFNLLTGIGCLAAKQSAFMTEEQVAEAQVEVVDANAEE